MYSPALDDESIYTECEYDEESNIYYGYCPFCGKKQIFNPDNEGVDGCEHLIYAYEDANGETLNPLSDKYIDFVLSQSRDYLPDLYEAWVESGYDDEDADQEEVKEYWENFCREEYNYSCDDIRGILKALGYNDCAEKIRILGIYFAEGLGTYAYYIPDKKG